MRIHQLSSIVLCAVAPPIWGASASNADADAIRALEVRQEATWNDHNAHAYAQLFTSDADIVNVVGWWWKSRAELEQKLDKGFRFVFARSHLRIDDVAIRFLTAEVAIAHVQWSMTGAVSPDGSGGNVPQKGIQTQTLHKTAGGWLIAAFQNCNAVPEREFPSGPRATR
jgi:uncharacterized protein (TIGR02246 family)